MIVELPDDLADAVQAVADLDYHRDVERLVWDAVADHLARRAAAVRTAAAALDSLLPAATTSGAGEGAPPSPDPAPDPASRSAEEASDVGAGPGVLAHRRADDPSGQSDGEAAAPGPEDAGEDGTLPAPAEPDAGPSSPAPAHQCETCGRTFKSASGLGSHRRSHGDAPSSNGVCANCGEAVTGPLRKGRCKRCDTFWRERGFERPSPDDDGLYPCPDCEARFESPAALGTHRGRWCPPDEADDGDADDEAGSDPAVTDDGELVTGSCAMCESAYVYMEGRVRRLEGLGVVCRRCYRRYGDEA